MEFQIRIHDSLRLSVNLAIRPQPADCSSTFRAPTPCCARLHLKYTLKLNSAIFISCFPNSLSIDSTAKQNGQQQHPKEPCLVSNPCCRSPLPSLNPLSSYSTVALKQNDRERLFGYRASDFLGGVINPENTNGQQIWNFKFAYTIAFASV